MVNTEIHNQPKVLRTSDGGCSAIGRSSILSSSIQSSGNIVEGRAGGMKEPEDQQESSEKLPPVHELPDVHSNAQQLWFSVQDQASENSAWIGEASPSAKDLLAEIDAEGGRAIFLWVCGCWKVAHTLLDSSKFIHICSACMNSGD